jgi:hypothetical protein
MKQKNIETYREAIKELVPEAPEAFIQNCWTIQISSHEILATYEKHKALFWQGVLVDLKSQQDERGNAI